ncbi:MAG: hypothetical protein ACXAE3_01840 [Candidatus Kariarchaeaceae archaeon]|jgi:predicted RNA binding protein with dsRBD fold (UPF0201 family)
MTETEPEIEPTYIELVVEARLNSTELKKTIETLLKRFLSGDVQEDQRSDGTYLLIRQSGMAGLQLLGDWIRDQQVIDTVRKRLFGSIVNNITALYFNRQAAAMGRLALLDVEDKPPNGPIIFQIVSDGLHSVIRTVAPRTYKGRVVTEEEWVQIQEARREKKRKKDRSN